MHKVQNLIIFISKLNLAENKLDNLKSVVFEIQQLKPWQR